MIRVQVRVCEWGEEELELEKGVGGWQSLSRGSQSLSGRPSLRKVWDGKFRRMGTACVEEEHCGFMSGGGRGNRSEEV